MVAGRALAVGVEKLSRAQPTVRVRPGAGLDACPCPYPIVLTEASQAVHVCTVSEQQCKQAVYTVSEQKCKRAVGVCAIGTWQ